MLWFKINCEIVVDIIAKNIDEAEEMLKNKYTTTGVKFHQTLKYKEIQTKKQTEVLSRISRINTRQSRKSRQKKS